MSRLLRVALPLLVISLALASAALALTFPVLSGRVVDDANILSPTTRSALNDKLEALQQKTGTQLVVVTLKSLQGTSIENYGVELGRAWHIGQKGTNNGALLIVAPNERKVRIEVGYGLEGTLTDALTKVIIETVIIPRFRANDYPGGITAGADDIIQVLAGDAELFKQQTPVKPTAAHREPANNWFAIVFVLLWFVVAGLIVLNALRQNRMSGGRRYGGAAGLPWIVPIPGPGRDWSSGSSDWSGGSSGGGFSGGGGDFGGGGSSGSW
jgi:uncharacterized protein